MMLIAALLIAILAAPVVALSPGLILAELVNNKTSGDNNVLLWHFDPNENDTQPTQVRTVRGSRQKLTSDSFRGVDCLI